MGRLLSAALFVCSLVAAPGLAQESGANPTAASSQLIPELKFFEPFIGKTFRGEFAGSTPAKPMFDVSRWERAMNGRAIRMLHSVNDGEYGGETIVMWDSEKKQLRSWYFTTAGFHTEGSFTIDGSRLISTERVTGNENGITEVRSTSELHAEGNLSVKSEYLAKGSWVPGHQITYKPAPDANVVFK